MSTIRYWEQGAPAIATCLCGGRLLLVEDLGPKLPVEAQCDSCLERTGVSHDLAHLTGSDPTSPEALGF